MRSILFLSLITLILTACGGSCDSSSNPTPEPGAANLVFTQTGDGDRATIRTARAAAANSESAAPADFELGNIDATTTYLFMLRNTGSVAATSITITTDNPAVKVSPGVIGLLQPEDVGGLQPIIRVTVQHGLQSTGLGNAPILARGELRFTLSATATSNVFASAVLEGNVRVASYELRVPSNFERVRLSARDEFGVEYSADGRVGQSIGSATTSIVNTGNAPLYLERSICDSVDSKYNTFIDSIVTVEPGAEYQFELDSPILPWRTEQFDYFMESFIVGTGGVVRSDRRVDECIGFMTWRSITSVSN